MAISLSEYLKGHDKTFADEYTEQIQSNAESLLEKINEFLKDFSGEKRVNSGWRAPSINGLIPGASKGSNHIIGKAVDLNDQNGDLFLKYVLSSLAKAAQLGLYFEHPNWTRTMDRNKKDIGGWVHIQDIAPKSKKRIYIPSSAPAINPNFWDGKYDSKWDK